MTMTRHITDHIDHAIRKGIRDNPSALAYWKKRLIYPSWLVKQLAILAEEHGEIPQSTLLADRGDSKRDSLDGFRVFLRDRFDPDLEAAIKRDNEVFRMMFLAYKLRCIHDTRKRLPVSTDVA